MSEPNAEDYAVNPLDCYKSPPAHRLSADPQDATEMHPQPALNAHRFLELFARCCPQSSARAARRVFRDLAARYAEPIRHYHTAAHINHCLQQHDLAQYLMGDPDAVEMALWFHDAIYVPGASDNERKSAELFLETVRDRCDARFQRDVSELILVTDHRGVPRDVDDAYVVDIDLSGFGLPWATFLRQSQDVRKEMADLSSEAFVVGQCRFLESLLERQPFYFTDFFEQRYGDSARSNIKRYIADLKVELA